MGLFKKRIDHAKIRARLDELRPQPVRLPVFAGEGIQQAYTTFAEIMMLYAVAHELQIDSPESIGDAARRAVAWYYGGEP